MTAPARIAHPPLTPHQAICDGCGVTHVWSNGEPLPNGWQVQPEFAQNLCPACASFYNGCTVTPGPAALDPNADPDSTAAATPPTVTLSPLKRAGLSLECAAGQLTGAIQRAQNWPATSTATAVPRAPVDLDKLIEDHDHARRVFRATVEGVTGLPASWIERMLAL